MKLMKGFILKVMLITVFVFPLRSIEQYYCTAVDSNYVQHAMHLIGSIQEHNWEDLSTIFVIDLGLHDEEKRKFESIEKVVVLDLKKTNPSILTPVTVFQGDHWKKMVPGSYAWKSVTIKQVLEEVPYVLWLDAGTTVMASLNDLFFHIKTAGHFLCTIGDDVDENGKHAYDVAWGATQYVRDHFLLEEPSYRWLLHNPLVMGGIIGMARGSQGYTNVLQPLYQLTYDLRFFHDDGTTPNGFGTGRHDMPLMSVLAFKNGVKVHAQDSYQKEPMFISGQNGHTSLYITWRGEVANDQTSLYSSRGDYTKCQDALAHIHYRKIAPR